MRGGLLRINENSEVQVYILMSSLSDDERKQLHTLLLRLAEQHLPNCRLSAPR